jgi:inhibitor of cysteine peptidase
VPVQNAPQAHFEPATSSLLRRIQMDEKDNGSQVELALGQDLTITLESNPSTGFRWEVVEIDQPILQQVGEAQYVPADPNQSPLPGQAGRETLRFQAVAPGRITLQLAYHRSWEKNVEPQKTYTLHVLVR